MGPLQKPRNIETCKNIPRKPTEVPKEYGREKRGLIRNLRMAKEEMGLVLSSILDRQIQHFTSQKQLHATIRPLHKSRIAFELHTAHEL
jgi:hypothetical protein